MNIYICAYLADDLPLRLVQHQAPLLQPLPVDVGGGDGQVAMYLFVYVCVYMVCEYVRKSLR